MMSVDHCLNCSAPVRQINYALGETWMHVDLAASFPEISKGTAWMYCRQRVATPDLRDECKAMSAVTGDKGRNDE